VAAFIGSPAMNLLRGQLVARSDGLEVEIGETVLRLPRALVDKCPGLGAFAGRELVVGIRPEDIEDAEIAGRDGNPTFQVRVSLAEAMGADVLGYLCVEAEPALGPRY